MSTEQASRWKYLAPKPASAYQQLFVNGSRIAARTLYSYCTPGEDWPGQSVEELAVDFNLPVEAVREAIAYCQSDPPEVRADLTMEEVLMEARGQTGKSQQTRVLAPWNARRLSGAFAAATFTASRLPVAKPGVALHRARQSYRNSDGANPGVRVDADTEVGRCRQ